MDEIVRYTRDNSFQRIKAWYIDETKVTLTDDEEKRKTRFVHIWSLRIHNKYTKHQIIKIVIREHNVSQATAYRDYTLSQQLFGDIDEVNVAAERMVLAEKFDNLYQMALKSNNVLAAISALREYKSLFDFADTGQKVDPKKLQASVYKEILSKPARKMMDKMLEKGVMDFMTIGAEDVEWKKVDEKEELDHDTFEDEEDYDVEDDG